VKSQVLALITALSVTNWVFASDNQPREEGIESDGYVWNEMYAEKLQALRAKGDALRGEIAFEICQGCHRPTATGRPDGSYPRLAGQHGTVLVKQMTDVRAGRRDNKKMFPFIDKHAVTPQEISDIAAYLQGLPVTPDNGKGEGSNLGLGREIYDRDCAVCHGKNGEGDSNKFYPRVSGQHYRYLLRESILIRDGERRNANPEMAKMIKRYNDEDLKAVNDYMSRFTP